MQNRRSWQSGSESELEDVSRRKVAIRSFIEAGLATYARPDYVAKEPDRIRSFVFANGLRFGCKKEGWSTIQLQKSDLKMCESTI
jgi:hypothetical protein